MNKSMGSLGLAHFWVSAFLIGLAILLWTPGPVNAAPDIGGGLLTVGKSLQPANDAGTFNLLVDGNKEATAVGNGGSTSPLFVSAGDHTVDEEGANDSNLADYNVAIVCQTLLTGTIFSSAAPGPWTIPVHDGDLITCIITNTRKTGTIEVVKSLVPNMDAGKFNLQMDGVTAGTGANVGNAGTTGELTTNTGSHSVGETAGTATTLADYKASIECIDDSSGSEVVVASNPTGGSVMVNLGENQNIQCIITNTRKTGTIEVIKSLVPNTDAGKFNLQIDGISVKLDAGHNGTTGQLTTNTGSHSVGETAGTATTLADYNATVECKGNGGSGAVVASDLASGSVTINLGEGQNIQCIITNTRKTGTIEVIKSLVPNTDAGKFNLQIDGISVKLDAGHNGTTGQLTTNTGSHSVGETAGTATTLADYNASVQCNNNGGSGAVVASDLASGSVTVNLSEGENIRCIVTNTRKTGKLTVRKALTPAGDPGIFNLLVDNVVKAANIGNAGTTGELTLATGNHSVQETASAGFNLDDYTSAIQCVNGNTTVASASNAGPLNVPVAENANIICTISNSKKPAKLSLSKSDGGGTVIPSGVIDYSLAYKNEDTAGVARNTAITETVPAHTTFAGPANWSCTVGAPAGTLCRRALGNIEAGSNGTVHFQVIVDNPLPVDVENISNSANIGDDVGPNTATASDNTPVVAAPILSINKTDGNMTVEPGELIIYTLNYKNTGNQATATVRLTETVPANTTFNGPGGWAGCVVGAPAGTVCTRAGNTLEGGDNASIGFRVKVHTPLPAGVTEIVNTAKIGDAENVNADSDGATTPVLAAPGLSLSKTTSGSSATPGGQLSYTLSYTNSGNQEATNVIITETVPANTSFVGPASWSCVAGDPAGSLCTNPIGDLPGGEGGTLDFQVQVDNPLPAGVTHIHNTAQIGSNETPSVDSATVNTPVNAAPQLTLSKTANLTAVAPGDELTYTLHYANVGDQAAVGVVISETVPAASTFAGPAGWSCVVGAPAGTLCTYGIGNLNGGGVSGQVEFHILVNDPLPAGVAQLENVATIGNPATADAATASLTTTINAATGLTLSKHDSGPPATPGSTIDYTLEYANHGNQAASNVVITETVPAHTTFAGPGEWSCSVGAPAGTLCTLTVGTVEASTANVSASFQAKVDNPLPAGVTQIANSAWIGNLLTPNADSGSDTTQVIAAPTLTLTKSDGNANVAPGGELLYTLTFANTGNQAAAGVVISETVPANTTFVGPAGGATGWNCPSDAPAGSSCTHPVGNLMAGTGDTVEFRVRLNSAIAPNITQLSNTAHIGDNRTSNAASASDSTPIIAAPTLTLSKSDNNASIVPTAQITYTLRYGNTGNRAAANVVITETVPANTTFVGPTGWGCAVGSAAGTRCTSSIGTLAVGATGSRQFMVKVNATLPAGVEQIINSAQIGNPQLPSTTASDNTPVTAAPDLSLSKGDGGVSVRPGDPVVYTLSYLNAGNQGASGVVISETVPAHTSFDPVKSTAGWHCPGGNTGVCTYAVGNLNAGAGGNVAFAVKVENPLVGGITQVENQASIHDNGGNGADQDASDNGDSDSTPVNSTVILRATKRVVLIDDHDNNGGASPGDKLEWRIQINNTGNTQATGVVFQDALDNQTTIVTNSVQASQGTVSQGSNANARSVVVNLGSLAGNGSTTVTFQVLINSPLPPGIRAIANQAVILSNELGELLSDDPDAPGNNDPTASAITGTPLIAATLTDYLFIDANEDDRVSPGDTLFYRLVIVNNAKLGASEVRIDNALDPNATLVEGSVHSSQKQAVTRKATNNISLNLGPLPAGARVTVSFQVRINQPMSANSIRNQAVILVKQYADSTPVTVYSKDPDTGNSDPTITLMNNKPSAPPPFNGNNLYLPLVQR